MGQILIFLGVLVYMYTEPGSPHKQPHVHVYFGGEKAALSIPDGKRGVFDCGGEDLCPDDVYENLKGSMQ